MPRRVLFTPLVVSLVALAAFSQSHDPELAFTVDPEWPRLPAGKNFAEVPGVSVDAEENVYVFHRGLDPIMVFKKDGKFLRAFGNGIYGSAHGLRLDHEGNIWTTDVESHVVLKMDNTGRVRMVLGRRNDPNETPDRFNQPTDVAIAPNGDIFVSDGYGNSRIVKLAPDGVFIRAWGKRGVGEGEFNTPHSIVLDKQGNVYVADRENFRIQIFDRDGNFLREWKHVGSPWGHDFGPDDSLHMTDGYNNRVLKLNLDGQILGSLGEQGKIPGRFELCHHLAVGPVTGSLYVGDITNWRVQKFVRRWPKHRGRTGN